MYPEQYSDSSTARTSRRPVKNGVFDRQAACREGRALESGGEGSHEHFGDVSWSFLEETKKACSWLLPNDSE